METWRLLARESIRDLITRYNSNGDAGRFDEVLEQFAPDAVMDFGGRVHRGHAEILTIFTGTQSQVRSATTPQYVRHLTATHQIDVINATRATGRSYFAAITATGLDHWGRYLDEYRVVDGSWRIAARVVRVDGQSASSLFDASV